MEKHEEILKELKGIDPRLSEMEKKDPFVVPDHYFMNLQDDINKKIEAKKNKKWFVTAFSLRQVQLAVSVLTIILIITFVTPLIFNFNSASEYEKNITTESYVLENVDEYFIEDYLTGNNSEPENNTEIIDNIEEEIIIEEL